VIRVCLVAPSARQFGGQAVQAADLGTWLQSTGEVDVQLVPTDARLPGPLRVLESVRGVRTVVRHALLVPAMVRVARGCDVVHVFAAAYWSFLLSAGLGAVAGVLARRPVIVNYHSGEADDHLARWRRSIRWVLRRAACVIVPSDFLAEVFGAHGYDVQVIPNGISLDRFKWRARSAPYRRILSTRSFERHYNVQTALRAFARILAVHPDARLSLVGGGSEEAELRQLAGDLRVADAVTFVGRVTHAKIHEWYESHDLYLNSSQVDNQPLSILEAMAAGMVVITTAAGGIPNLVKDRLSGRLVAPGSAEALARAALDVMDDEVSFSAMARAAAEAAARHDPQRVATAWITTYRAVAAHGGRGRRRDP
jgi:glycosyltransferase involved in cell wall biosynthesis